MPSPAFPSLEELRAAAERDADRLVEDLFAGFAVGDRPKVAGDGADAAPAPLAVRAPEALAVLPGPAMPDTWREAAPATGRAWERWFFLSAVLLLLGSFAWFWRSASLRWAPLPAALPVATAEIGEDHQEFIAYLQKSLAAIERDERHARQLSAAKAEREQRERAEREAAAARPAPAAIAQVPVPPQVAVPPVPPPPVVIAQSIAPPAASPPVIPPPPTPSQPLAARVEPVPSAPSLAILGLLEIDNLALALIEVDGKTERVAVGENVPGTAWSVATIAPRRVVLRDRAGEERTVPVGSRF